MMKKKVAAFALVGALGVTGLAPMSVSAANGNRTDQVDTTQTTEVTYFAGAGAAGANAYVQVPASIDFEAVDDEQDAAVKLITVDDEGTTHTDGTGLATDFKAGVEVSSGSGFTLVNGKYSTVGKYQLVYGSATANSESVDANAKVGVGTLKTGVYSIEGTATLTEAPKIAGNVGLEKFNDILTYTITVNKDVENKIPDKQS